MAFDQVRGSRVYRGIYHLDGNTLTICVREGLADGPGPCLGERQEGISETRRGQDGAGAA
jgi:hypothetical protein